MFSDADGSTPIDERDALLRALVAEADVAIGSRYFGRFAVNAAPALVSTGMEPARRPTDTARAPSRHRRPALRFKAFAATAATRTFAACTVNGWSFDLEVLARASANGFGIW